MVHGGGAFFNSTAEGVEVGDRVGLAVEQSEQAKRQH